MMQDSTREIGRSWDVLNTQREECLRTAQAIAACIADDVLDGRTLNAGRVGRYAVARNAWHEAEAKADACWDAYKLAIAADDLASAKS